jgi:hypothetical protein
MVQFINVLSICLLSVLCLPAAPDLGRSKHATSTAHVTEGTLSRALGAATSHTGDTGHSATSTPGLSRCLYSEHSSKQGWKARDFEFSSILRASAARSIAAAGQVAYLVTSTVGDAVRLPVVLGHVGVHEGDNVRADGGSHHAW